MSNLENFGKVKNPFTGVFGTGKVEYYWDNGTFTVPSGITSVRVRCWGSGGYTNNRWGGGGGGGFAMKTITGLTSGASISVTVPTSSSGTASFGAYVSATGGVSVGGDSTGGTGGTGVGGDINYVGGKGSGNNNSTSYFAGGGGAASLHGNGGDAPGFANTQQYAKFFGGAGGGSSFFNSQGTVGISGPNPSLIYSNDKNENYSIADLDFIGTGTGCYRDTEAEDYGSNIYVNRNGRNGGGGSNSYKPGIPGGGGFNVATDGQGLIVVEY